MAAPNRLYPLRWHAGQQAYMNSRARFNLLPCGRRSGKTENAKRKLVGRAFNPAASVFEDPRYFAAAPTYAQAKAIYWGDLKKMIPPALRTAISETDLMIRTVFNSEIWVFGMDKPERIEGRPWDGGVLDEYANMKPGAWGENVRPALSDRNGWCDLIGVPEGRNHYYDLWQYATDAGPVAGIPGAFRSSDPEWAGFTWHSSDVLPRSEVEAARRQLDPLVFAQEYEASFVNFTGRAYYPFTAGVHTGTLNYNPDAPLIFCFDFNVDPGVAAVCQEQYLPHKFETSPEGVPLLNRPIWGTGVIGEVWIPRNSNTPAVCRKLAEDWGAHRGPVYCYGDATGGARGTAKVAGSDWDLIRETLRATFGDRLELRVPRANPPERTRVNAVNSRLMSSSGEIRLMVDAHKAPHVVRDLEGVTVLEGGAGELDKKANRLLTHISDGLGYYIVREFPINDTQLSFARVHGQ